MNNLATAVALLAIVSAAIIYGTDLFCALIVRPAAAGAADASVADLLGRVHEFGDRRLPIPGVVSIIATALAIATSDSAPARIGGATALAALLVWPSTCASAHRSTRGSARPRPTIPSRQTPGTFSNAGTASSGPAPYFRPSRWPACSQSS
jgi:hypothetical protein